MIVTTGSILLTFSGWQPGMVPNILQCRGHSPTTKNFQAQHIHCVAVEEKICSRFLKGASIYSGTPCVSVPYPVTIKYLNKIDIHCLSSCALTCVSQPSARINGIKL